jgi:hypothetical protein
MWELNSLKINMKFLEMEWSPKKADQSAAWELYIELLTRVSTQYLQPDYGDEKTALESIHVLFPLTREIMKKYEKDCQDFAKIAIPVLNQIIRPFTAKWHRLSINGAFSDTEQCKQFRAELVDLQQIIRRYTALLGDMAGVEDLSSLELR